MAILESADKLDTPSLLLGVGAGVAGFKVFQGTLLAGVSILLLAGVPLAIGYLGHLRAQTNGGGL